MAALDFPSSPSLGTIYPNPAVSGQPQYTWDGEKWTSGTGFGNIYIADSAPAAPVGSLWWESDTGILYVSYNDGTSTQWVAIAGGVADAVRYGAAQSLTSGQRSQARANIDVTKKNYIINGAMMVSQENSTATGAISGVTYWPVDMFFSTLGSSGGTATIGQVASPTPAGSSNRIRFTVTTATTTVLAGANAQICTAVEGYRATDLKAGSTSVKTVTLQFGVRAPAGIYCVSFNNAAANRFYPAEYVISAGEANTDVVKSITLQLDQTGTWTTDNTRGLDIRWWVMGGSSFFGSANVWTSGGSGYITSNQSNLLNVNGNVFELFDVSLTEGTVAPPFMVPNYDNELFACQRYFWSWQTANQFDRLGLAYCDTTTSCHLPLFLPCPMRAAPTFASAGVVANGIGLAPSGVSRPNTKFSTVYDVIHSTSGLTANTVVQLYCGTTSGAAIALNARL